MKKEASSRKGHLKVVILRLQKDGQPLSTMDTMVGHKVSFIWRFHSIRVHTGAGGGEEDSSKHAKGLLTQLHLRIVGPQVLDVSCVLWLLNMADSEPDAPIWT